MNKIIRCLCIMMTMFLILTGTFGCNKKKEEEETKNTGIPETTYDLVMNGSSNYKIVYPAEADTNEKVATSELITFMGQATGIDFEAVEDTNLTYNSDSKYISVGSTSILSEADITVPEDLDIQGFILKTSGQSIFIIGGSGLGTLWGAYEFLHNQFGYEAYSPSEIALNKNVKNLKLLDFDFADQPDIEWRDASYEPRNNMEKCNRMRYNNNIWMYENGNFIHNTFSEYLPKNVYYSKHPKWYSEDRRQLCYTAHGDEEELTLMRNVVVERIKHIVTSYYNKGDFRENISFTQEDNNVWCECEECKKYMEKYGEAYGAATLIQFINPVARAVKEWVSEAYPGHTVNIIIFSYFKTGVAPVQLVNGEYQPMDGIERLEDNVAIFYAPYTVADYHYDFSATINASCLETIKKWNVLTNKLYLWLYNTQFGNYLTFFDSFNSMPGLYKMAKEHNALYLFDEGQDEFPVSTGFSTLKNYLNSKLAWNVNYNYDELINDFFRNYYREAGNPLLELFNNYREYMQYLRSTNTEISGKVNIDYTSMYYPKNLLLDWMGKIDKAYESIEKYKTTNPELYQTLADRICIESISVRYSLINNYSNTYSDIDSYSMKTSFKNDAERLGFTLCANGYSMDVLYQQWGI